MNGFGWQVVYTYDTNDLLRDDGVAALGVTDRDVGAIFIYAGLKGALLRKVLMHELSHAAMWSYGLSVPPEYEEAFCGFFDSHAEEILRAADELYYDNKDSVK